MVLPSFRQFRSSVSGISYWSTISYVRHADLRRDVERASSDNFLNPVRPFDHVFVPQVPHRVPRLLLPNRFLDLLPMASYDDGIVLVSIRGIRVLLLVWLQLPQLSTVEGQLMSCSTSKSSIASTTELVSDLRPPRHRHNFVGLAHLSTIA